MKVVISSMATSATTLRVRCSRSTWHAMQTLPIISPCFQHWDIGYLQPQIRVGDVHRDHIKWSIRAIVRMLHLNAEVDLVALDEHPRRLDLGPHLRGQDAA